MNLCHHHAEDIQISEKAANWSVDGSGLVSNVGRLINGRLALKGNKETRSIHKNSPDSFGVPKTKRNNF